MGHLKGLSSRHFHALSERSTEFLKFHPSIPDHGLSQPFLESQPNSVGKVVGFVNNDDDVFEFQIHCLET